ncbi:DUF6626 family protein [Roseobacter sp. AzwK-3b]|uniref:DUF6626 family protein n=1 Tax=Roseobacter sp. AzwK-3b TaxID=351016 RepID=UPI0018DDBB71|nr:DUF6626 family protein [Roseobacter sp. AzwK-3b]
MTIRVLEAVRDELKTCHAIGSEREFCEQWLGKSECYIRTLRFNDLHPSADALMTCASKLGWYAGELQQSSELHHKHWAGVFGRLREDCVTAVEQSAHTKWRNATASSKNPCVD